MTRATHGVVPVKGDAEWDDMIRDADDANVFQSAGWGDHRRAAGWEPLRLMGRHEAGLAICAQVLTRRMPLGITLAWSPGGPMFGRGQEGEAGLAKWWKDLLAGVSSEGHATYVRFDCPHPDTGTIVAAAAAADLRRPIRRINTALTTVVRIDRSVEVIVGAMRKEHRRELRRAEAAGLRWRGGRDASLAHEVVALRGDMLAVKGLRVRRAPSGPDLEALVRRVGGARVVVGYQGDEPVTGALILEFGGRAILHTLASGPEGRRVSASYALILRTIELLAAEGVVELGLGGISSRDHPRGVDLFKIGFGGDVRARAGEWEWASRPGLRTLANAAIAFRGPAVEA